MRALTRLTDSGGAEGSSAFPQRNPGTAPERSTHDAGDCTEPGMPYVGMPHCAESRLQETRCYPQRKPARVRAVVMFRPRCWYAFVLSARIYAAARARGAWRVGTVCAVAVSGMRCRRARWERVMVAAGAPEKCCRRFGKCPANALVRWGSVPRAARASGKRVFRAAGALGRCAGESGANRAARCGASGK